MQSSRLFSRRGVLTGAAAFISTTVQPWRSQVRTDEMRADGSQVVEVASFEALLQAIRPGRHIVCTKPIVATKPIDLSSNLTIEGSVVMKDFEGPSLFRGN